MHHVQMYLSLAETQRQLSDFFAKVAHAPSCAALLLDYYGTLAPFSPDRQRAAPYPGIPSLLDRVRESTDTRLVVITGRRAIEIPALLGIRKIEVWGCHGLSRLHANGSYELPNMDDDALRKLSEANDLLRQVGLFNLLEFKPGATAIHWRGIEADANKVARKVEKVWSMLHGQKGLELLKFDGGMEIRVAGRNKGRCGSRHTGGDGRTGGHRLSGGRSHR